MMRWILVLICLWPGQVLAEGGGFLSARQPLFDLGAPAQTSAGSASLFTDRVAHSLFAPWPAARERPLPQALSRSGGDAATRIRDLIARAEAGPQGYDAVQYGARIKPPKRPTQMTLREIDDWIRATPGQPHAIGRYQFIPKTLRWLVQRLDLPPETRFSPAVQDRLGDLLLADAGLEDALAGHLDQARFMKNLARTWAGLPLPSGKSYYEGYAGNKATMRFEEYRRAITAILSG